MYEMITRKLINVDVSRFVLTLFSTFKSRPTMNSSKFQIGTTALWKCTLNKLFTQIGKWPHQVFLLKKLQNYDLRSRENWKRIDIIRMGKVISEFEFPSFFLNIVIPITAPLNLTCLRSCDRRCWQIPVKWRVKLQDWKNHQ